VFSQQEAATRRTLTALDQVLTMYERNLGLRFNNTGSGWHCCQPGRSALILPLVQAA
jgi:hypothetical protein